MAGPRRSFGAWSTAGRIGSVEIVDWTGRLWGVDLGSEKDEDDIDFLSSQTNSLARIYTNE